MSGTALFNAWAAYRRGDLRLRDLRIWFACLELVARRCALKKGKSARYRLEEIHGLVGGVGGEHIRHSIARLERTGMLSWSESSIVFPRGDELFRRGDPGQRLDLVPNHRRLVPVPRRIIRLMAGGARRVAIATILGHLLRCLYYRQGRCLPVGTCKASWIADLFGVHVRNVKMARKHLVAIGWLVPIETRQTVLNRFGQRIRVNLAWSRNDRGGKAKRSPPRPFSTAELPPPYKNKKLLRRSNNQKPERGPTGVSIKPRRVGKPSLRHFVPEDLHDPMRLHELYQQAVGAGLIRRSQCDRLRFFAAAEHARVIGTQNPCGLFATLVRKRLWTYITQDDEDAAIGALKQLDGLIGRADLGDGAVERQVDPGCRGGPFTREAIRAMILRSLSEDRERLPALAA